jgi:hypothetical protein
MLCGLVGEKEMLVLNLMQLLYERIGDFFAWRGSRAPNLVLAALLLVAAAGCTSSDAPFSNVLSGLSQGISNAAANLTETLLVSLFI